MKHDTPTITAQPRPRTGSRFAKRLRTTGRLPAVIYGHKSDPLAISVDEKEIVSFLKQGAHVINVSIEGAKTETCLVKDLQFGYLGDDIIHLDFARVNLDEEVHVNVHLHFIGTATEAKRAGAIVSHPMTELPVVCKVNAIPEEIKVDMSITDGTVLTVGELVMPAGVKTDVGPETPVMTISFIHEEEAAGEEVEVGEVSGEPEVITEARDDAATPEGES